MSCVFLVSGTHLQFHFMHLTLILTEKIIALENHIDKHDDLGACHEGKPIIDDVEERFCAPLRCLVSPITGEMIDVDARPLRPLSKNAGTEPPCRQPSGGQTRTSSKYRPQVSFIMPVHNNVLSAAQSILELFRTAHEVPSAQFIVVNDGSTEDFSSLHFVIARLQKLFGINVALLRSPTNHGFSAAVRAGLLHSKGKWVVLVNSDVFVGKGWLKMLHATAENSPRAGIVGPLFLGDGMIVQEAGGIVFRDGSAANGGRGARTGPVPAHLNHMRLVDYISGGCIMLKRSEFLDAGGFQSDAYGQGYYEDTDLAMEMRKMGKAVIYQPLSVVFHQEGGTFGTDEDSELKRSLMSRNKVVFYNKWNLELQHHCKSGTEEMRSQYRLADGKSVLFVDYVLPDWDHDSGSLRTFNILRLLLRAGYHVSFRSFAGGRAQRHAELRLLGVQVFPVEPIVDWKLTDSKYACLYDVAIVSRRDVFKDTLKALKAQCPDMPVVFDTVDIHFLREARVALTESSPDALQASRSWDFTRTSLRYVTEWIDHAGEAEAERVKENKDMEMDLIKQANATWIVSPAEFDILQHFGATEDDKISVVSNLYELPPFQTTSECDARTGILFVGNLLHAPNHQAIVTLLRDVLPMIIKRLPRGHLRDFKVHIAGANDLPSEINDWVRSQVEKSSYIKFHGFLSDDSLRDLSDNIRIVVAPLLSGAGVKGKVNDAMIRGIPVVTTPIAAEGMHISDGKDCMVASTPSEFALKVVQLYTGCDDLWHRLAKNGYRTVSRHFSMSSVAPFVMETFSLLGVGPGQLSRRSACGN